jgi:hypothetical protein
MRYRWRIEHTFTSPSAAPETTRAPSGVKQAALAYAPWPRNSLSVRPDLRPCMRTVWSKDVVSTCGVVSGAGGGAAAAQLLLRPATIIP